ncbi:MAG: phage holin family protein [Gemmatimonadaceae bacterium]
MTSRANFADADAGIPDLVRRLTADSSHLIGHEVRLAKLEAREALRSGARGAIWLAIAFGAMVLALTALTVLLTVALGRLTGNMWAGALITGAVELVAGGLFLRRGLAIYREPDSYTLGETRAEAAETTRWVREQITS